MQMSVLLELVDVTFSVFPPPAGSSCVAICLALVGATDIVHTDAHKGTDTHINFMRMFSHFYT